MTGQVLAYVRVSTADHDPDRQVAAIGDAVAGEPDRWFTGHGSGGSTNRVRPHDHARPRVSGGRPDLRLDGHTGASPP